MLSDELRARVNAHADREWPHVDAGDPDVNSARAARRLTFRQGVEWAMSHTSDADLPESVQRLLRGESVVVPRPHVPYGPHGVPEMLADADYLDSAARNLSGGYAIGGYNVTSTVIKLLHDSATALRASADVEIRRHDA